MELILLKSKRIWVEVFLGHPRGQLEILLHSEFGEDPGVVPASRSPSQARTQSLVEMEEMSRP